MCRWRNLAVGRAQRHNGDGAGVSASAQAGDPDRCDGHGSAVQTDERSGMSGIHSHAVSHSGALPEGGLSASDLVKWVGLSGLEPLTSALSGQRSNRLSYRPEGAPVHLGAIANTSRSLGSGSNRFEVWSSNGLGLDTMPPKSQAAGSSRIRVEPAACWWFEVDRRRDQSSARVISRPPSMVAARL